MINITFYLSSDSAIYKSMCSKLIENLNPLGLDVAKRIKKVRDFLGFTQPDFAIPLGISRSKLANLETGRTVLSFGMAVQMARVFIISEWWLATGEGSLRSYQNWTSIPELVNVDQSRSFLDVFRDYFGVFLAKEQSPSLRQDFFENIEMVLYQDGQNAWQLWNMLQYVLKVLDPRPEFPDQSDPELIKIYRLLLNTCYLHLIDGMGGQEAYDKYRLDKNKAREGFSEDVARMLDLLEKGAESLSEDQ
ncbi:helix-turn-helix transcriptional regulator [Pontiellaceae bacterium B12219]|nr:helix-turn-helix transcriptional regulator [Pontiellaceae bacterium B12219]